MSDQVTIKTRLPDHAGEKRTFFNAGALTQSFVKGVTDPVDKETADAFIKSFGHMQVNGKPAFEIKPIKAANPTPPKSGT